MSLEKLKAKKKQSDWKNRKQRKSFLNPESELENPAGQPTVTSL
jgi:hypothetical protein